MSFQLPDLKYDYNALEPNIDARTMEIHHSKHHAAYTANLNKAVEGTDYEGKTIEELFVKQYLPEYINYMKDINDPPTANLDSTDAQELNSPALIIDSGELKDLKNLLFKNITPGISSCIWSPQLSAPASTSFFSVSRRICKSLINSLTRPSLLSSKW